MIACPKCNGELVPVERAPTVSIAGLIGAVVGVAGIIALFANPLLGIGLIVLGAVIGATMRRKKLVLICPRCKTETKVA